MCKFLSNFTNVDLELDTDHENENRETCSHNNKQQVHLSQP